MAKIIGQEVEVAVTKESSRGTVAVAQAADWIQRGTIEISPIKDLQEVIGNVGRITTTQGFTPVHFENEITISHPLERKHIGKYLMGFYGSVSTSANTPESGTYTHALSVLNTGIVPTYTVSVLYKTKQVAYALGYITNVKLTFKEGELPMVSVTYLTKKQAATSGLTASYGTNSFFSPVHVNAYGALSYASLASATALDVIGVDIEYTRDPLKLKYLGSDTHKDVRAGDFVLKAHVVAHFDQTAWGSGDTAYALDDYIANTTRAFRLQLIDTNTTIGTTTNPRLTIDIPQGVFAEYTTSLELKELVGEEFDIVVKDDTTNGYSVANVINDIAAY
jgi:hypothetical protein